MLILPLVMVICDLPNFGLMAHINNGIIAGEIELTFHYDQLSEFIPKAKDFFFVMLTN